MKLATWSRWIVLSTVALCLSASAEHKRWFVTHSWSGEGMRMSEPFWVNSDQWMIRCRQKDDAPLMVHICDMDNERVGTVNSYRGVLNTFTHKNMQGKGYYYFQVANGAVGWEIEVLQCFSKIEEWQFRESLRERPAPLSRLATWHGAAGEKEFAFRVPAGSWRLTYSAGGKKGHIEVSLIDEAAPGDPLHVNWLDAPGKVETWVHCAGAFRLSVKSDKATWEAEVAAVQPPPEPAAPALPSPPELPPPGEGVAPVAPPILETPPPIEPPVLAEPPPTIEAPAPIEVRPSAPPAPPPAKAPTAVETPPPPATEAPAAAQPEPAAEAPTPEAPAPAPAPEPKQAP